MANRKTPNESKPYTIEGTKMPRRQADITVTIKCHSTGEFYRLDLMDDVTQRVRFFVRKNWKNSTVRPCGTATEIGRGVAQILGRRWGKRTH